MERVTGAGHGPQRRPSTVDVFLDVGFIKPKIKILVLILRHRGVFFFVSAERILSHGQKRRWATVDRARLAKGVFLAGQVS